LGRGGDHALGNLGPQNLVPTLSLFCRNASTDNGSKMVCTQLAQESALQSRIATEWVAEDGRLHSNQVRWVRTSELSSMGQPVPELVPVPVLRSAPYRYW